MIIITDNAKLADGLDPAPLVIPRNGPLTAVTAVLPLQLIAYVFFPLRALFLWLPALLTLTAREQG